MPIYLLGVEFSKEQSQVVAFEVEEARQRWAWGIVVALCSL
jgi:hypothetical protein